MKVHISATEIAGFFLTDHDPPVGEPHQAAGQVDFA
jgi:hypothetical protein